MRWLWHEIALWIGLTNASGPQYLFWSGFFGDMSIFAAAVVLYRRHNCHARWCWRIARHPVEGTHYVTCRHHHPEMEDGGGAPTSAQIRARHRMRHISRV